MTPKATACALLLTLFTAVCAEISPESYYRLQEGAKDYFDIKIVSFKATPKKDQTEDLKYTAEVLYVYRSSKPVKKGEVITIEYNQDIPSEDMAGPMLAPALKPGEIVPAYLVRTPKGTFTLAKYGRSFEITQKVDMRSGD